MNNKKHLNKIIDKAVSASFDHGKINANVVSRLVKDFKSMHLSDAIYTLTNYLKGLKRILSQYTLEVESVISPSRQQLNEVQKKMSKLFTITRTKVTINPSLLGGLKVRVGDTVLDYSVRNKLNQISEAIING